MNTYFQTFIGAVVSVMLFLITYKQTVGAKKERVKTANADIEKTLLRRIVLESYKPSINDILRLIEGKARDYHIRVADLPSVIQVMNTLFTRIVESDFVILDQREKILERINPALIAAEEKHPETEEMISEPTHLRQQYRIRTLALLAVTTSLIGSLTALSMFKESITLTAVTPILIWVFGISILAITLLVVVQKIKESQEEPRVSPAIETGVAFEKEVFKTLQSLGIKFKSQSSLRDQRYDFIIEHNGKKVIVELKAWSQRPPIAFLKIIATRLQVVMHAVGADEAIILTKQDIGLPPEYFEGTNVKLMSLKLFRNNFAHSKR